MAEGALLRTAKELWPDFTLTYRPVAEEPGMVDYGATVTINGCAKELTLRLNPKVKTAMSMAEAALYHALRKEIIRYLGSN